MAKEYADSARRTESDAGAWRTGAARSLIRRAAACAAALSMGSAGAQDCQIAKLTAPNGFPADLFGYSLAISQDHAAIGMPNYLWTPVGGVGAAWTYVRVSGTWTPEQFFTASDGATGDIFGFAVAMQGGRLAVSARGKDALAPNAGAAYVFERNGGQWQEIAKLHAPDGGADDWFGYSIALDGDTLVVGAPHHDAPVNQCGALYVFERQANGSWQQTAKLSPEPPLAGNKLGWCVAIHDDVIVAGTQFDGTKGFGAGAAHVFERSTSGQWMHAMKLFASDPTGFASFGAAVATNRNLLLVGSSNATGYTYDVGAVYVFESTNPGIWLETGKLFAEDGKSSAFGGAVSFDGSTIVVGDLDDMTIGSSAGAAYVFARSSLGEWTQQAKIHPEDLAAKDQFGSVVSVSGSSALVGEYPYESPQPGTVYVFAVGPDSNSNGLMDPCECPGDLNKDWIVDQADLGLLLANWGCTGGLGYEPSQKPCPGALTACCGDLDADGDVDQADLGVMLQNFGNVCP